MQGSLEGLRNRRSRAAMAVISISISNNGNGNGNGRAEVIYSLALFAVSAKLWLSIKKSTQQHANIKNDNQHQHQQPNDNGSVNGSALQHDDRHGRINHAINSERRRRHPPPNKQQQQHCKNIFLQCLYENFNWPRLSRFSGSFIFNPLIHDEDGEDDSNDETLSKPSNKTAAAAAAAAHPAGSSPTRTNNNNNTLRKNRKRSMSYEERLFLMERVQHHDSVLTRETSFDFHPKNSNWNHFENYSLPTYSLPSSPRVQQPSSPSGQSSTARKKRANNATIINDENQGATSSIAGVDSDEYFLWSDPPLSIGETNDEDEEEEEDDDDDARQNTTTSAATTKETTTAPPTSTHHEYTDSSLLNKKHTRQKSKQDFLHCNAACLPSKLIMVRHGQSEGNVDELLYATKPDNALRLTKLGWEMARMAGKALRDQLPQNETVHFIVSPYARTVETFHGIVSAWCDPSEFAHVKNRSKRLKMWYTRLMEMGLTWHEDPRIREQDFGNYQDPHVIKKAKSERHKFGSFYYRFPYGESASDVFDRVSTFLDSLWRSFESGRAQNYVLVAHGISIRVFLTRYFRYSIDQFHMLANPKNCEMVVLAHDGQGRLKLDGRCELELNETEEISSFETKGRCDGSSDAEDRIGKNRVTDDVPKRQQQHGDGDHAEVDKTAVVDDDEAVYGEGQRSDDSEEKKSTDEQETMGRSEKSSTTTATTMTTTVVTGYKKHSRLRTLPPQWVRTRTVRMCYDDTAVAT